MPSKSTIDEMDKYDEQAGYWHHRSLNLEDVRNVIAERSEFDRERLKKRKPGKPRSDSGGAREDQGVGTNPE